VSSGLEEESQGDTPPPEFLPDCIEQPNSPDTTSCLYPTAASPPATSDLARFDTDTEHHVPNLPLPEQTPVQLLWDAAALRKHH
jgi:hypothetical protein